MNTKLHAICDSQGCPHGVLVTAGQVNCCIGERALLSSLPEVGWLLGDHGYDTDWFREALNDKGKRPYIPGMKSRDKPVRHDKRKYKRRNRIEIMFGGSKIGAASRPATTDARRSSYQPSLSMPSSSTGFETQ